MPLGIPPFGASAVSPQTPPAGGVPALITERWTGRYNRVKGVSVTLRQLGDVTDKAYKISGVTRDSTGAALGNCQVQLFYTPTDTLVNEVTSDASGNYSFRVGPNIACYAVAYLAGSPDRAGTTVNTLTAV